jgi:hypothetical protein
LTIDDSENERNNTANLSGGISSLELLGTIATGILILRTAKMLFATPCTIALIAFSSVASSWEFEIPSLLQTQWSLGWLGSTQPGTSLEDPSRNHIKAYQTTKKPILFSTSPNDPFESPRLSRLNSTAWEQWYFDSVSNTGTAGLTICFSRDPSYEFFGKGNLRIEIDIVWDNGTTFSQVDFASESVVEALESTTRGTWNGPGIDYSFEINNNLEHVKVTIDTPNVKGAFTIASKTPPQYADGSIYPSENASMSSTTFLHWVEAIPVGLFEVDLMIGEAPFTFTGIGGHDRIWAAFNWITMVQGWHMIRAAIGPYSLTYWEPKEQKSGLIRPSAFLAKNGQRVFSAQTDRISQTESYATFSKLEGGHLHGGLGQRRFRFLRHR